MVNLNVLVHDIVRKCVNRASVVIPQEPVHYGTHLRRYRKTQDIEA